MEFSCLPVPIWSQGIPHEYEELFHDNEKEIELGRAALKIEIGAMLEKTETFIKFLDSIGLDPKDLPQEDFRALAETDSFFRNYSEILNSSKYLSAKQLAEAENNIKRLAEIIPNIKNNITNHILGHFAAPNEEQFKNYHAYPAAEKAWYEYEEFIKRQQIERFGIEKMQALIDKTSRPDLLLSIFVDYLGGASPVNFRVYEEALCVIEDLINHTPLSGLSSKTRYQKGQETKHAQFNKFKEERNNPGFSDYDFDGLFKRLGSKDAGERKTGEKLLNELWENYVDEKHGRIKTDDRKHYKNIIALWDQMKRRFHQAKLSNEKLLALKPFTKLWCTFIPYRFYDELKDLILKGIVDENGMVRYRVVRLIDTAALAILDFSPEQFEDLRNGIVCKRDEYMRQHKLLRSRRTYSNNIHDGVLRSLTQAMEFLEDRAWRMKTYGPSRLSLTLNE